MLRCCKVVSFSLSFTFILVLFFRLRLETSQIKAKLYAQSPSLAHKYYTRVKVTDSYKLADLLNCLINCQNKKFYSTGANVIKLVSSVIFEFLK